MPPTDTMDPGGAFKDAVRSLRELGRLLGPAVAARWDTPPGVRVSGDSDPTGATVADERRSALSDEVTRSTAALLAATAALDRHAAALDRALRRWEGHQKED